jgi:beta-phosphoglucomutase family hydrolase
LSRADTRHRASSELRLPEVIEACLFDMDGVLTDTAKLHAVAWELMFNAYLRERGKRTGEATKPFDARADYKQFVDGKPRADGVRSFLASRGIELAQGSPCDPARTDTVAGLGNRKNDIVLGLIREEGVHAYPGSVRFVKAARFAGLRTAVVTSSANCGEVLAAAQMTHLFETIVDGTVIEQARLRGKPAPDTYLHAAQSLDARPAQAAVFEDALAGVEAGRAGGFGYVVGVDHLGRAQELRAHGADIVVTDLAELLTAT